MILCLAANVNAAPNQSLSDLQEQWQLWQRKSQPITQVQPADLQPLLRAQRLAHTANLHAYAATLLMQAGQAYENQALEMGHALLITAATFVPDHPIPVLLRGRYLMRYHNQWLKGAKTWLSGVLKLVQHPEYQLSLLGCIGWGLLIAMAVSVLLWTLCQLIRYLRPLCHDMGHFLPGQLHSRLLAITMLLLFFGAFPAFIGLWGSCALLWLLLFPYLQPQARLFSLALGLVLCSMPFVKHLTYDLHAYPGSPTYLNIRAQQGDVLNRFTNRLVPAQRAVAIKTPYMHMHTPFKKMAYQDWLQVMLALAFIIVSQFSPIWARRLALSRCCWKCGGTACSRCFSKIADRPLCSQCYMLIQRHSDTGGAEQRHKVSQVEHYQARMKRFEKLAHVLWPGCGTFILGQDMLGIVFCFVWGVSASSVFFLLSGYTKALFPYLNTVWFWPCLLIPILLLCYRITWKRIEH